MIPSGVYGGGTPTGLSTSKFGVCNVDDGSDVAAPLAIDSVVAASKASPFTVLFFLRACVFFATLPDLTPFESPFLDGGIGGVPVVGAVIQEQFLTVM